MGNVIKVVKFLEDSALLLKGVTETVQNKVKEQKGGFLSMLSGTLGASLFGNILTGRGINRAGKGQGINRVSKGIVRAGYRNKKGKNGKIQKCSQNESRFNCIYSRDNLPKIKYGANVINFDEHSYIGNHWVALYVHNNDVTYFDSFGVENIPK